MAAEYSANALQTVAPGESVVFTETPVACNRGLIYHRDDSGLFRLANKYVMNMCGCRRGMNYQVAFHANIQIPTGGSADPISLAMFVDGEEDPSSMMIFTPAATGDFGNVGADIIVSVPWICRCSTVSVRNTSSQAIQVQNANIVFNA